MSRCKEKTKDAFMQKEIGGRVCEGIVYLFFVWNGVFFHGTKQQEPVDR